MKFFSPRPDGRYSEVEHWLETTLPQTPPLAPATRRQLWQRAQQNAASLTPPRRRLTSLRLAYPLFSFLLLLGFLGGYVGIVFASGASIPGDSLYAIERQAESLWMTLTPSPRRDEVRLVLLERRIYETRALLDSGRDVPPNLFQEIEMLFMSLSDDVVAGAMPQLQHDRDVLQLLNEQHPGILALQDALDAANASLAVSSP